MTAQRPRVATLAAIIDTFTRIVDGREVPVDKPDQLGGAGIYGIIGARIFLPPERLAMIVDYTPDTFPAAMRVQLESYGSDMWEFRVRDDGHGTTRAVNRYEGEKRGFEYLSAPRLLFPSDLAASRFSEPPPAWLHLVSYPDRAAWVLAQLGDLRSERGWVPGLLWEPEPPCCIPENLDVLAEIAAQVDVISPNHTEAMTLFRAAPPAEPQLRTTIEWATRRLVALRPRLAAIVRAGSLGCCYALSSDLPPGWQGDVHSPIPPSVPVYWVPAYWSPGSAGVVDPTGAGNAFMGGLMAALDEAKSFEDACIWANVAASFVIEQDGLPTLQRVRGDEVWNGDRPRDRVAAIRERMARGEQV